MTSTARAQPNGTTVDLYTCNGTGAQDWVPQCNGSLVNLNSGNMPGRHRLRRVGYPSPDLGVHWQPLGSASQRELEVLELVAGGSTNREAAARLFVSEATAKTHLLHIYAKLGVSDCAAAVAKAFNRGLLTPSTKHP